MPGIDFRQLQFFPRISERTEGSFRSEPFAPAALHEMEPHFEIHLAGCIDPGPKPAAADEIAIAVIEQRPILNTTGSLSLDLGVEFLMDLGFGEFAARINERRSPATTRTIGATASACSAPARRSPAISESRC